MLTLSENCCFRGATLSVDRNWQGKSALICAIESGSWDLVVHVLNSSKTDINKDRTKEGWTPLIVAARHGHVGLVDLLINRGKALVHFLFHTRCLQELSPIPRIRWAGLL